jgi:hypothetical protein
VAGSFVIGLSLGFCRLVFGIDRAVLDDPLTVPRTDLIFPVERELDAGADTEEVVLGAVGFPLALG